MQTIREQVLTLYNAERELLEARREESRRTNAFLLAATLVGSAIILLIGALSVYMVQSNARQREQAQRALQDANENLETIVANAPPTCARPTTRFSALPISSATTCDRHW